MSNQDKPTGKVTRIEMEVALDYLIESLPVLIRRASIDAQMLKVKYDALVAEGFSKQQALEIVKSRPLYE